MRATDGWGRSIPGAPTPSSRLQRQGRGRHRHGNRNSQPGAACHTPQRFPCQSPRLASNMSRAALFMSAIRASNRSHLIARTSSWRARTSFRNLRISLVVFIVLCFRMVCAVGMAQNYFCKVPHFGTTKPKVFNPLGIFTEFSRNFSFFLPLYSPLKSG